jgi:hypothetical protein
MVIMLGVRLIDNVARIERREMFVRFIKKNLKGRGQLE